MSIQDNAAAEIMAVRARQTQALFNRDFKEAARYWTEDVTMRRALGDAVTGASEYGDMLATASSGDRPISYSRVAVTVDVSAHWPLAYEEGRWTGHLGRSDEPAVIAGRYAAQWVKRGGEWLIRSEVFVALTCEGAGSQFVALA